MNKNILKGKAGEEIALNFLLKNGFRIIDKNWRYSRSGEIDIVAFDKKILVFVEVKARSSINFGHPIESITTNKMQKMKSLAITYLSEHSDLRYSGIRFDVIGIILGKNPEISHYKDIYQF